MRSATPFLLLYDGDCRVCSGFAQGVARLVRQRSLRARPIQSALELLPDLSPTEALAAAHVLSPDGSLRTGPSILPALVAALVEHPGLENRLDASPAVRAAARWTYALLAEIRGGLSCASGAPS